MADEKELYKKVAALKDLRGAIKEVKKANMSEPVKITKADPAKVEIQESSVKDDSDMPLKYLGRKKMLGGILSHMIGSGKDGEPHYQMDVHLEKHSKNMPSIILSHMSPKGEVLDHSPEYHKDMKSAIKSIVSHKMKKCW